MKDLGRLSLILVALVLAGVVSAAPKHHNRHRISTSRAKSIALHRYHGRVVGKVALENEDGKWEYAVNIRSGRNLREVMIDANTGKIASVEVTSKAEEAKEAAAEAAGKKNKRGK